MARLKHSSKILQPAKLDHYRYNPAANLITLSFIFGRFFLGGRPKNGLTLIFIDFH